MGSQVKKRAWELDFVRGFSIFMMILMHLAYDLRYIFGLGVFDLLDKRWFNAFLQPAFVCVFAGVSGICCVFSHNNLFRALKLGMIALVLTLATAVLTYKFGFSCLIVFNILHVLASGLLIYSLIEFIERRFRVNPSKIDVLIAFITALICVFGVTIRNYDGLYKSWAVLPWGIKTKNIEPMADWLPFFPWAGVFLCGTLIGRNAYKTRESLFSKDWLMKYVVTSKLTEMFEFMGRHSLIIYAVHQPIVLGILYVIFFFVRK